LLTRGRLGSVPLSAFFRAAASNYAVGSPTYNLYTAQAPSVANSPQITKTDTFEGRLAGNGNGPLQWTAGFFYSNRFGNFASNIVKVDGTTGAVPEVTASNLLGQRVITDRLKQTAGFAEATYKLTSKLSVTGGLRYFSYDRRVTGAVTVVDALVGFSATPATDQASSEHGFLYKGNASYKISSDVMAYATVSSGQRPGGVNQNVSLPGNLQSYKADSLWNYEAGVKSQFLDRAVTLNADVFQIDWDNMQTSGSLAGTNFAFITNAGRARARGIEVESTINPYKGLQFNLSGSYIDAHLTQDQTNQTLIASGLKGDPIPSVPKTTVQGGVQYGWALNPSIKATLRSDVYYSGSSWTVFRRTNAYQNELPAYATVSLRAGISAADDSWSASLFVNNLFDDKTVIGKLSASVYGGLNNVRAISNVPRTIGIDVMKHFG
jgi:outer membrane receptor protein involved in Fe transport